MPTENPAPEPEVAPPALEAALIAFDDDSDEESYQAVVGTAKPSLKRSQKLIGSFYGRR